MKDQNSKTQIKDSKIDFRTRIYRFDIRLLKLLVKIPDNPVIREIKSQFARSGTSMGDNYFEAKSASSKKDYINFFTIALKSTNESIFWLSVSIRSNLIPEELLKNTNKLLKKVQEIASIFSSSILTMKGKRK